MRSWPCISPRGCAVSGCTASVLICVERATREWVHGKRRGRVVFLAAFETRAFCANLVKAPNATKLIPRQKIGSQKSGRSRQSSVKSHLLLQLLHSSSFPRAFLATLCLCDALSWHDGFRRIRASKYMVLFKSIVTVDCILTCSM